MLRRALIVAAVCAVAGLLGTPANAARPALPHSVSTTHFVVHYTSDPTDDSYANAPQALALASDAEHAYAAETGWGFSAPLDDGDGKVDIYLLDLSSLDGVLAYATTESNTPTATGYITYGIGSLGVPDQPLIIAHELFHVLQFATWGNPSASDAWLFEGSAEWAAAKVYDFPASKVAGVTNPDFPLDCRDSIGGFLGCDSDPYTDGGYSRWPFFQALAARYGASFLQTVLAKGATGMSATNALTAAIGAKGGTLSDVYGDWAMEQMIGSYGIPALDARVPTASPTVPTGVKTTALASFPVAVDHLSTRYIAFTRGDGAADHPCFAATLTVTVTVPSGVSSKPTLFWNVKGSAPVALAGSGSTLSATIPWDTCFWSKNAAYLALPNTTTTVDAAAFVVGGSVTVDPNTPAAATAPPDQAPVYGGTTTTPTADVVPAITLLGPLLLHVSADSPTLRLIVEASGEGKVHALLGSVDLGTPTLRAGNNDLRFTIPKSVLGTLRRSAAAGNVLSLTPLSPSGAATGTAVTRTVSVTAPAKPKAKPKPKPKKKQ
jgi:hypothetical protein